METDALQAVDGYWETAPEKDILKITVVNRYAPEAPPMVAFVRGFGLKGGALASSVAHDSHNIVAVGATDEALATAVNAVIECKGGISACDASGATRVLPLPIAGLMSPDDGWSLAASYAAIDAWTKETLGCVLQSPFMALSFLALPVIPALKITDLGLFDVSRFQFTGIEMEETSTTTASE
jgi:adenine deaminase